MRLLGRFDPLSLCISFILGLLITFVPSNLEAEGAYLVLQILADEPIKIDLSRIGTPDEFYVFPRNFRVPQEGVSYLLEPDRVVLVKIDDPSLVIEVLAKISLEELVEGRVEEIRKLNEERNGVEVTLAQLRFKVAGLKEKLKRVLTGMPHGTKGNADGMNAPPWSEEGIYPQFVLSASLLKQIADSLRAGAVQRMRKFELDQAYDVLRLDLTILLNLREDTTWNRSAFLSSCSPAEVIGSSLDEAEAIKKALINDSRALSQELAMLNDKVGSSLRSAFSFSQPVDPEGFISKLSEGEVTLSEEKLAEASGFREFANAYVNFVEKTEDAKVVNSQIFAMSGFERTLRESVARSVNPRLLILKPEDFKPAPSISSACTAIHFSAPAWRLPEWEEFLESLALSVKSQGTARVKVPVDKRDFSSGRLFKVYPFEVSALLSAVGAHQFSSSGIMDELLSYVQRKARGARADGATDDVMFWEFAYFMLNAARSRG